MGFLELDAGSEQKFRKTLSIPYLSDPSETFTTATLRLLIIPLRGPITDHSSQAKLTQNNNPR